MTAAENIRAYLSRRYAQQEIEGKHDNVVARAVTRGPEGGVSPLRETDLEVVLQMQELLSGLVRETSGRPVPAEITTHEQVFDLPEYTVLQDCTGQVWQRYSADPAEGCPWETMNDSRTFTHHAIQLPARVLVPRENT